MNRSLKLQVTLSRMVLSLWNSTIEEEVDAAVE